MTVHSAQSVHLAEPRDATDMATILSDWIDEVAWMPRLHTRKDDLNFVTRQVPRSIVCRQGGILAGFLTLSGREIDCLYVARQRRGQGVGTDLLDHAKTLSPVLTLWTFLANTGARRFYAREGFTEVRRTDGADNQEKLPDVRFEWCKAEGA